MTMARLQFWRQSVRFRANLAISSLFLPVLRVPAGYSYFEERARNLGPAIDRLRGMNAEDLLATAGYFRTGWGRRYRRPGRRLKVVRAGHSIAGLRLPRGGIPAGLMSA